MLLSPLVLITETLHKISASATKDEPQIFYQPEVDNDTFKHLLVNHSQILNKLW